MDLAAISSAKAVPLPLASLRLLAPPLQLLSASMWQIVKKKEVMSFWQVSEFVSFVMEMVPELLLFKHWTQLTFGLRAQFILELCRKGDDQDVTLSHLTKIKPPLSTQHREMSEEEKAAVDFAELIHSLLKDDQERQIFFQEWSEESGAVFDTDLQMLFWEFLCRLNQLLPPPELEQTVSWLGQNSVFEDFLQCLSDSTHIKNLLHHHKQLGHLEQHVPPSSMGDHIFSRLSAASSKRTAKHEEKSSTEVESSQIHVQNENLHPISFVDNVAMEIVTVTEYAEVELSTNSDIEVIIEDTTQNGTSTMGEEVITNVLPDDVNKNAEENEAVEETKESTILENLQVSQPKTVSGPHSCPDCNKKFKFASFLVAHRVIHTGERPHKCTECGRCFSFRQSLERHRHTHKTGKSYECTICSEKFPSLTARNAHKQIHIKDGEYNCQRCDKKFTQELALEQHLKTDCKANSERVDSVQEVLTDAEESEPSEEQKKSEKVESVIDPQLMNEVISLVKVRTSGRKRKPTMKVQMSDSQKRNKRVKEREKDGGMKPAQPLKSSEHSYGATTATSKEEEGAVTDGTVFSCPQCDYTDPEQDQVQQHINSSHCTQPDSEKNYPRSSGKKY
ncbi:putative zinc finger protein 286B [Boleophthalmus pectinirostris]|uniref:putative zinc finger protein 286B n=1 Tax=Boleophthalmus pectinirostris TaxID=150288 RepID=UPI00242DEC5E|nr:putative zinc finger protein 286B [Boleophthalmus pectinirostris]